MFKRQRMIFAGERSMLFLNVVILVVFICSIFSPVGAQTAMEKATTKPQTWSPGEMPKSLVIGSQDVGTALYVITAALGEGIAKKFGVRVRSLPGMTSQSRILNAKLGNVDLGAMGDELFGSEGLYDFATMDWGPQPLRMVYVADKQSAMSLVTTADSGIKTPADLKGKRAGWLIGSPLLQNTVTAGLAFAGLTLKDVKLVEVPSTGALFASVFEGKADFAPMDSVSPSASQLQASPKGIYWIPFPIENKEGWARLRTINPQLHPLHCKYGAGLSERNPVWVTVLTWPQYFVYPNVDEGKVYWIVRMFVESYNEYKDLAPAMPWHKLEEAIKAPVLLPYHPGAIRYFKEKGVWTAQLEKNQGELLDRQSRLQKLWKETVDEARKTGVREKDFPNFWSTRREKGFPNFWVETK
jgi:TRAP transporter TAXI family solute receptor